MTTGEEDASPEVPEGMSSVAVSLYDLDLVVPYPIGKVGSLDGVFGGMEYHKKLLIGIKGFPKLAGGELLILTPEGTSYIVDVVH